jgi:chromosome partitioning protein
MSVVIAFMNQKGGVGKTMLARAMAVELAKAGKSVVLVDLDVNQRTATNWAEARKRNGVKPEIRVDFVDLDEEPDFRLAELAADFDVVIFDAPGWTDTNTLALAQISDLCVLPTGLFVDDLYPTMMLVHELNNHGIDPRRIAIVLNRKGSEAQEKFARRYLADGELSGADTALPDRAAFGKAGNGGQAAGEVSQKKLKEAVQALVTELLGKIDAVEGLPKRGDRRRVEEMPFVLKRV